MSQPMTRIQAKRPVVVIQLPAMAFPFVPLCPFLQPVSVSVTVSAKPAKAN
jgi:hypothetical protein